MPTAHDERTIDELQSCEQIRQVLFRYARAVDRCDVDLLRQAYHPDAVDIHGKSFAGSGWRFAEWLIGWTAALPPSRHTVTNIIIDLDGERARVESQYDAVQWFPLDDERFIERRALGRYLDVFERRDGKWRILHRRTVPDASQASAVSAADLSAPTHDGNGSPTIALRPRHAPDDPVYLGYALAEVPVPPFEANDPAASAYQRFVAAEGRLATPPTAGGSNGG